MTQSILLNRRKLALALSEIDEIRQKLPEGAVIELAQEVVKRVASKLATDLPPKLLPSDDEVNRLCEALISRTHTESIEIIEATQKQGASYEDLCQSYLAVASRRLGEWWTEDRVSFYQVTIAAGRIYAMLRTLRENTLLPLPDFRRSAVFIGAPGEDHTLGITIAADMARNRGWDIELFVGLSHDELILELEKRDPPLIGLSASTRRALPALIKLIVALRLTNPDAKIILCGHIATLDVNLEGLTGVDTATSDFDDALAYMERLVMKTPPAPET